MRSSGYLYAAPQRTDTAITPQQGKHTSKVLLNNQLCLVEDLVTWDKTMHCLLVTLTCLLKTPLINRVLISMEHIVATNQ